MVGAFVVVPVGEYGPDSARDYGCRQSVDHGLNQVAVSRLILLALSQGLLLSLALARGTHRSGISVGQHQLLNPGITVFTFGYVVGTGELGHRLGKRVDGCGEVFLLKPHRFTKSPLHGLRAAYLAVPDGVHL